ncbi:MAG: hypothetical protein J0L64_16795 [Acidobacteria bacterium]|nr:hypothetical protein [Acidobacteriota bacterium]
MLDVQFEREPEGFRMTGRTLQFEGLIHAAFACGWAWGASEWVRQERQAGAGLQMQHLFFGIPIALAGIYVVWIALLGIVGKVVVRGERSELTVWEGVAFVGSSQRFSAHEVTAVDIGPLMDRSTRPTPDVVRVHLKGETKRVLKFGVRLNERRRERMVELLRQELGK